MPAGARRRSLRTTILLAWILGTYCPLALGDISWAQSNACPQKFKEDIRRDIGPRTYKSGSRPLRSESNEMVCCCEMRHGPQAELAQSHKPIGLDADKEIAWRPGKIECLECIQRAMLA
jgi:hypothetical protein